MLIIVGFLLFLSGTASNCDHKVSNKNSGSVFPGIGHGFDARPLSKVLDEGIHNHEGDEEDQDDVRGEGMVEDGGTRATRMMRSITGRECLDEKE